ncbi:DNA circularization N-terminal domain-containing protein [bacterium]|nr:DNA circularization N-terminal domain-containing protein [bacterium]
MGWSGLEKASFRGVEFHVSLTEDRHGRRLRSHDIPGRDDATHEDLGRSTGRFQVEAFLIGPTVLADRHRLQQALEAEGPGRLKHPFYGSLDVLVDGEARFTTRSDRGKYIVVVMPFVAYSPLQTAVLDPITEVDTTAGNVLTRARAWMNEVWDIAHDSARGAAQVVNTIDDALALVHDARRAANSVADIRRSIDNARSRLTELVYDVEGISQVLATAFTLGSDPDARGDARLTAGRVSGELEGYTEMLSGLALPSGDSETADIAGVRMQADLLAAMARVAIRASYDSSDEALELAGLMGDRIQELVEVTTDPELGQTLQDLQGQLLSGMRDLAVQLPNLVEVRVPSTLPALVLAWDYYRDLEKEADLIARNGLEHPGFVPGGTVLEVVGQG